MYNENQLSSNILPVDYGDNRINLMLRDPNCLFAYWELSGESKSIFSRDLGNSVWERSVPVLKVNNLTGNSSFYIRINDFSNSWYINTKEPGSLYTVEIGRKLPESVFIPLAASNPMLVPDRRPGKSKAIQFADYRDIQYGKAYTNNATAFKGEYQAYTDVEKHTGLSSAEYQSHKLPQETLYGLSSGELYGISSQEFSESRAIKKSSL